MQPHDPTTALLALLGEVLAHPDAGTRSRLGHFTRLAAATPTAAAAAEAFCAEVRDLSLDALGEIYTRTFDVMPSCVPYLSVHLFGEESFHRARLMSGLHEALHAARVDARGELPDHLAVVLRAAPALDPDLWADLVDFVVRASLHAMSELLATTDNPYRHLLRATQILVGPPTDEDLARLAAARRAPPTSASGPCAVGPEDVAGGR